MVGWDKLLVRCVRGLKVQNFVCVRDVKPVDRCFFADPCLSLNVLLRVFITHRLCLFPFLWKLFLTGSRPHAFFSPTYCTHAMFFCHVQGFHVSDFRKITFGIHDKFSNFITWANVEYGKTHELITFTHSFISSWTDNSPYWNVWFLNNVIYKKICSKHIVSEGHAYICNHITH